MKLIQSTNYNDEVCTLVYADTNKPVPYGTEGITGGRAPHKPASSGKIWIASSQYYPNTHKMKWARLHSIHLTTETHSILVELLSDRLSTVSDILANDDDLSEEYRDDYAQELVSLEKVRDAL